jgi:endo-1,4-beta-D-glucanase Y
MKRIISLVTLTLFSLSAYSQNRPFPQAINFPGCIKPSGNQSSLNSAVSSYYQYWKPKYVRKSNGGTPGGGYYIAMKGTGGSGTEITTSEAHGYGMITFALMAGFDDSAKIYYDGMYNMYNKHRSTGNSELMSWQIDATESTAKDDGSATDGDMDVAYSMLLAHYQWGSGGTINYLAEAQRMITKGLKVSDMGAISKRSTLGDWDKNGWNTRSSDWMTDHFRAYYNATKDIFWTQAADTVYSLVGTLQSTYSPNTGLMPDFIVNKVPRPAAPNFLEADTDGDYSWNACRFPWRIATDFAHYGTPAAKTSLNKMVNWLKTSTANDPENIKSGYKLNGTMLPGADFLAAAFAAPFVTAAIADATNQAYLDAGWNMLKALKDGYYEDSINLLCMLLITGNWWSPISTNSNNNRTYKHSTSHTTTIRHINGNSIINFYSSATATARLTITALSGKVVLYKTISLNRGENELILDKNFTHFKNGCYVVNIGNSQMSESFNMLLNSNDYF